MDLIDRKYRILQAIIDDYILTALPVGSRTISRKYEQKLSSATIRNEMSDLEELGYLDSPHTSAGRVPSYKAYRLYVDQMLTPESLTAEEKAFINRCFDRRVHQVEELSMRIAKALSSMTHYTTAVMTRSPRNEQELSHLQLVPVADRRVLLILVTMRYVKKPVPDSVKPVICIYAAPTSLCIAGYIQSVTPKSLSLLTVLWAVATVLFLLACVKFVQYFKLPFFPSYAAYTFPFVISAIASKQLMACAANMGSPMGFLSTVVLVETIIATCTTLYALIRYLVFLFTAPKQPAK